jgi:uncharacterized protein YbaR (Trm112 family)
MSGLDEQFGNMLICPMCKKEIDYWVLLDEKEATKMTGTVDSWIWLYSEQYRRRHGKFTLIEFVSKTGLLPVLDNVYVARCCTRSEVKHGFTIDDTKYPQLLNNLIGYARKLKENS